jgi:hypothetical protein
MCRITSNRSMLQMDQQLCVRRSPLGCRAAPIARPRRAVLEPPIVIKNNGDRYQETPFNLG